MRYLPLVGAIAMGLGIICASQYKEILFYLWCIPILGIGAWILYRKGILSKKDLRMGIFFVFCFGLGYGNWLYHLEIYDEKVIWLDQLQGEYHVTIISRGKTVGNQEKVRYLISLEGIQHSHHRQRNLEGKAYLYLPAKLKQLEYGEQLKIDAILHRFYYFQNPGQVDFLNRHRGSHIIGNLIPVHHAEPHRLGVKSKEKLSRAVEELRVTIEALFHKALPRDQAYLLNSLLFGSKSDGLDKKTVEEFASTGIIHILSVSGAHVALLMAICSWILRRMGLAEWKVFVLATLLVGLYATLAHWVPSVTRAFIMGILASAAWLWQRENNALYALGIAGILMLLWSPFVIYDISFQLSTGATLGILLFGKPLKKILHKYLHLPKLLADVASLCVSAQIMLIPFLLYYFRAIPIYSFLGNLLVIPILECVIPIAIVSIAISFIWMIPALGMLTIVHFLLSIAVYLNRMIASLPGALWKLPGWNMYEIVFYYFSVVVLGIFLAKEKAPQIKYIATWLASLLMLTMWQVYWLPEWRVYIPDGGKSSVVLVERQGKYLLYYKVSDRNGMSEQRAIQSVAEYIGADCPEITLVGKKMESLPNWLENSHSIPLYRTQSKISKVKHIRWRDLDIACQNGNVSIAKYPHVLYIGAEQKKYTEYPWTCIYWNRYPSHYELVMQNCLEQHPQCMVFSESEAGFAPSRITEAMSLAEVEGISVYRPHQDGMIIIESHVEGWKSWKWSRGIKNEEK